jgi:hypothetical protein
MESAGSPVAVLIEVPLKGVTAAAGTAAAVKTGDDGTLNAVVATQGSVRRPMRGIQLKTETFASIAVSNSATHILNSSAEKQSASFTSNFLLQSVSESRQEKFQTVPTFGATYGFFFGEQPRIVAFQAILLNTADFQWEAEWWENYDRYLRGTRLVDRGMKVIMSYEDVILEGYIIGASVSKGEPNPWAANLSFQMWVTTVRYLITAGEGRINSMHTRDSPLSYDEFESSDGLGGAPSMLAEVRARNVTSLAESGGTGLIGALTNIANKVEAFTGAVGTAVDNAMDWLYGRNMVIPVGFAATDDNPAMAVLADGSGIVQLPNESEARVLTIRSPVRIAPLITVLPSDFNFYDHNVDEYPVRGQSVVQVSAETTTDTVDPAVAFAEQMFKSYGIDVSNEEGQSTSAVMQALGRASFAALSYRAGVLSAQDAANLAGAPALQDTNEDIAVAAATVTVT